ncbi:MAG: hypothetical protein Gaeavirus16_7 [Gaeavirus sp.]|uniref:Uncharacterized protein n=1 Tax=Gaeavirus sp. TaxID=2487767 RepID=A0A3G5A1Z3_9VIRU|nr:MAG: hypothetical protein Gaeavirus16_7 [Gaeavirus sp.]
MLPYSIEYITFYTINMDITNLPLSIKNIKIISNVNTSIQKLKIPFGCMITDMNDTIIKIE